MEREPRPTPYRAPRALAPRVSRRHVRHPPGAIAAAPLRAAIPDRPVARACGERTRPTTRPRPAEVPPAAAPGRRARRPEFAAFRDRPTRMPRGEGPPARELATDGRPLVIGARGKDPDADRGHVSGGLAGGAGWGDGSGASG